MSRSHAADARQAADGGHARASRERREASRTPGASHAGLPSNSAATQALGAGAPLEPGVRAEMEQRFGTSFADVRIHDDDRAHRSASDLEAKAYTHGRDIAFGPGRYAPHEPDGLHLLAHELAHVVQQRRGGAVPKLAPSAPHEAAAEQAAAQVMEGATSITVAGNTGVGVAREPEDPKRRKRKDDPGPVKRTGPALKGKSGSKPVTITDPKKATGVLGEVTTPFDVYSDPSWNNLGGGQETSSSRMSLARKTRWGDTAGLDNLVENRRTGRLVLGEQKRLGSASFTKATAITTNLEKNIANTVERLRAGIRSGQVHREEVANVENVIERLQQTGKALKNQTSLPEEVVFELTATGGKSTRIGKDYVSMLAEKYNPRMVERILARTYVRGKSIGRNPHGQVGTDTDPDIIPAKEAMTEPARNELERLLAGKSPKEWKQQKLKEKQAQEAERKRAKKAQREAESAQREQAKAEARKIGDEVRRKTLEELREAAKRSGEPEPRTPAEKRAADNALKKKATQAGKDAQKKVLDEARAKLEARKKAPAAKKAAPKKTAPESKAPETKVPETKVPEAKAPATKAAPSQAVEPRVEPVAPKVEPVKPTVPLEGIPRGVTPKEAVGGALGVAGFLAGVSGVKDIVKEFREGHYLAGAGKAGLLGLSFIPEAAPPLFAFGTIMNYWGPRHEKIQQDAFEVGDVYADIAGEVPLLGRSETFRNVIGGLGAANAAVWESAAYTVKDMGAAVVDGAETLGGLAEDAYDWLTEGPSMMDIVRQEMLRQARE